MPSLPLDEQLRIGVCVTKVTCLRCRVREVRAYCRECDDFFTICHCAVREGREHLPHRTYLTKTGDRVAVTYQDTPTTIATVTLASPNGRSLAIAYEGFIGREGEGGYLRGMALSLDDNGRWVDGMGCLDSTFRVVNVEHNPMLFPSLPVRLS